MSRIVIVVSKNLLDTAAISNSVKRDHKVVVVRELSKCIAHLSQEDVNHSLVVGYPLEAMTIPEHHDFMKQISEIKKEHSHIDKCVVYGPHERMRNELENEHDIACVARSIFFHDPSKWII